MNHDSHYSTTKLQLFWGPGLLTSLLSNFYMNSNWKKRGSQFWNGSHMHGRKHLTTRTIVVLPGSLLAHNQWHLKIMGWGNVIEGVWPDRLCQCKGVAHLYGEICMPRMLPWALRKISTYGSVRTLWAFAKSVNSSVSTWTCSPNTN